MDIGAAVFKTPHQTFKSPHFSSLYLNVNIFFATLADFLYYIIDYRKLLESDYR